LPKGSEEIGNSLEIRRSRNSFLGDTWANFKRWILKLSNTPTLLIMNLLQPVLFLLLFTEVFGDVASAQIEVIIGESIDYVSFLLPAIVIQVGISTASAAGGGLVTDIEEGIFEKLMVFPMSRTAIFLGKTFSEIVRIIIQIGIILGLGVLLGASIETGFIGALGVIGVGIMFSLIFISLTTIIAMITKNQETMFSILMPLIFPLLFLSSAFLPLDIMPGWIRTVARFNPVTYGIDAARAIVLRMDVMTVIDIELFSGMWNSIIPGVLVLSLLVLVTGGIAVLTIKRETSAEAK